MRTLPSYLSDLRVVPLQELRSPEKSGGEGSFGLVCCLDGAAGTGEGGLTGGRDVGIRGRTTVGAGAVMSWVSCCSWAVRPTKVALMVVIAKLKDHPRWMFRKNLMEFFIGLLDYLYKFYRGYTTTNPQSHVLLEYSTITWPCHMMWLPKFPCYL